MKHLFTLLAVLFFAFQLQAGTSEDRQKAKKLFDNKNWQESYDAYANLAVTKGNTKPHQDLEQAIQCLKRLRKFKAFDKLVEDSITAHGTQPLLLKKAAMLYRQVTHSGYLIDNEFERDNKWRNRAKRVSVTEKDRIRSIQLFYKAMTISAKSKDKSVFKTVCADFASSFRFGRWSSWRMQMLTEFTKSPGYDKQSALYNDLDDEFEDGDDFDDDFEDDGDFEEDDFIDIDYNEYNDYGSWNEGVDGASVDIDGNPVFYSLPKSFEAAKNDGERWRWLISQQDDKGMFELAKLMKEFFGVQTMRSYSYFFSNNMQDDDKREGIMSVHTLKDEETIAKLADGVKRFRLPDEFNHVKIYKQIAKEGNTEGWRCLAEIYENRRQYPKAAQYWQKYMEVNSDLWVKVRHNQIVQDWCKLENSYGSQPSGKGAKVDLRFRNGNSAHFTAKRIDYKAVLEAHKEYIKGNKKNDWQRISLNNLGNALVNGWAKEFVNEEVASWTVKLKPLEKHFDKSIAVTTPLQKAGLYLVKAQMVDGNESSILVWVDDTVIVRKNVDKSTLFIITDAVTGKPLSKVNVEFFAWKNKRVNGNTTRVIRNFAEFSDENGQIILKDESLKSYQLTVIVNDKKRFTALRDQYYNSKSWRESRFDQVKTFTVTDRPVYRPGQKVLFKSWVRKAEYDLPEDQSEFAKQDFQVRVTNPRGEKVYEQTLTADSFGGISDHLELPEETTLGVYRIQIRKNKRTLGQRRFSVEEYKKPEFEVKVEAPKEPLTLGEKFTAKVKANYYFGAPVTEAEVSVKVMRTRHDVEWFPYDQWDWCFGNGYWWFGSNYNWYPGWSRWGCESPSWPWFYRSQPQPELIANLKGHVDKNGEFLVTIDSALAKEIYGNSDHKYEITAEVRDASRRTIVGSGSVIAARQPFKVYAWSDRGYYHVGDTVNASFKAQTIDFKPITNKAEVTLYKISYDKTGKASEKEMKSWKTETNENGSASLKFKASTAGQFRISCKVTDAKGNTIEGAHVFTVRGKGFDGRDYRFNHIELVSDKKNYVPGEKVKLVINTEQPDSTVFLFVRTQNSLVTLPKVLTLDGKSTTYEIEVTQADMPNFFIEAMTVVNAKIHTATRQIVVPPQKRILNVDVKPSGEKFKPGEKAKVKLRLTDIDGKPFQGTMALAVYDKSLEYIAKSSIPDIKEFFWKWKRNYYSNIVSSFSTQQNEIYMENVFEMNSIGVFGNVGSHGSDDYDDYGDDDFCDEDSFSDDEGAPRGKRMMSFAMKAAPMMDISGASVVGNSSGGQSQPVSVRSKFADTAFWQATINTDENGEAEVEFPMPENLTTWKIKTWGVGHGSKVGSGEAEVITSKDFIIRLQAPRFFVEKDEVVLSANIHNYLEKEQNVEAILELVGGCLEPMDKLNRKITVKANGEIRVDWLVKAVKEGEVTVRMKAIADDDSDAMEMKFPVYVHGFDKMVPYCGVIRPEGNEVSFELDVPKDRRIDQTSVQINFSPSLAMAMIDALPYLVQYPYGCTEQTLNKFLPVVITNKLLQDMNVDLAILKDKHSNLNAQELGDPKSRRNEWSKLNPVYNNEEVVKMTKSGVERLTGFQNSDGGWGWFGGDHSYPHTTAVVVRGLILAKENGVAVIPRTLQRGIQWLQNYQKGQLKLRQTYEIVKLKEYKSNADIPKHKRHTDNLDALVASILGVNSPHGLEIGQFLYQDRGELSVYGKTLAALALLKANDDQKVKMMERNIRQFLKYDEENQTAYLENADNWGWWYWYGSDIEANASFLKLLSKTAPKSKEAAGLVKYLLNNRKHATYWNSTRDTALCIEAFADYIRATGEDKPNMVVEVLLNDKVLKEVKITPENIFTVDNTVKLSGKEVQTGKHKLTLRKKGTGPLYTNAYLNYFSLEEFITKVGLEVKVERRYYLLTEREKKSHSAGSLGQVVDKKLLKHDRKLLKSLDEVISGDLIEVELIIESKNDYEYILIEDNKAAGFEPVEVNSGYNGNALGAYVEYRDEKVCFFTRQLRRGKYSLSYRLRAEVPGKFSALPAKISAMYAPELRGNSDEIKIKIIDN